MADDPKVPDKPLTPINPPVAPSPTPTPVGPNRSDGTPNLPEVPVEGKGPGPVRIQVPEPEIPPNIPADQQKIIDTNKERRGIIVDRLVNRGSLKEDAEFTVDQVLKANPGVVIDVLFPDTRTAFEKKEDVLGVRKFVGSPVEVFALEYNGENWHEINDFGGEFIVVDRGPDALQKANIAEATAIVATTKYGRIRMNPGDSLIIRRGKADIVADDVEVTTKEIFSSNYREVGVHTGKPQDRPTASVAPGLPSKPEPKGGLRT